MKITPDKFSQISQIYFWTWLDLEYFQDSEAVYNGLMVSYTWAEQ